jgi:hypothetical protein
MPRPAPLSRVRHPLAYSSAAMGEEARRNAILTTLGTHYDGFTAEQRKGAY